VGTYASVSVRCLPIITGTKFQACQPVNTEHRGQDQEIIVSYLLLNRYFVAVYCSIT
jgi:hypothetical protein